MRATTRTTCGPYGCRRTRPRTERSEEGPADCELSGTAEQLYLTLWNRLPLTAVSVTGDAELAQLWREQSAITWS